MLLRDLLEEWNRKIKMLQKHYRIKKLWSFAKEAEQTKIKIDLFFIYAVITYIFLELLGFALSYFIFRVWGEGHGTVAFLLGMLMSAS